MSFLRRSLPAARLALVSAALFTAGCATRPAAPAPDAQPVRMAPPDTAPAAPADSLSPAFHAQFDTADTRARAIVYWMQCVATVARLRTEGRFGPTARAPRALHCQRTADGVPIGGVYDIDSAFATVRRLQLVRLDGARPAYTGALDTAQIARGAKLARSVSALVGPTWTRRGRPFSVVPISAANGAAEAWVVPRATKARSYVTGGDVGYTAGAGAAAPVLIADRTATWTQLTLPASGPLRIYSSVKEVAAVADLVTARYQAELGRTVSVSTPVAVSTLSAGLDPATGSRWVWSHRAVLPR